MGEFTTLGELDDVFPEMDRDNDRSRLVIEQLLKFNSDANRVPANVRRAFSFRGRPRSFKRVQNKSLRWVLSRLLQYVHVLYWLLFYVQKWPLIYF